MNEFPLTTWPSDPLPHPAVLVSARTIVGEVIQPAPDGETVVVGPHTAPEDFPVQEARGFLRDRPGARRQRAFEDVLAVGEIYLELEEVDLDDPGAIELFANRFGILGTDYDNYRLFRDVPGFVKRIRPALEKAPSAPTPRTRARPGRLNPNETLSEFRFAAKTLRDLRAAYLTLHPESQEPTTGEAPAHDAARPPSAKLQSATDIASRFLSQVLSRGLSPFHPLLLQTEPKAPGRQWCAGRDVPLYSVCCLELFNHITERAIYRRCANQRCQRLFVRQTGRAKSNQYRLQGVKYCSTECARATAQRMHRARTQQGTRRSP